MAFPDVATLGDRDIVAIGTDFRPGTLLHAYRHAIFPWPHGDLVAWFSPDPRAIFRLDQPPRWSRSLRRTLRNHPYEITSDEAFEAVVIACGAERQDGTWITPDVVAGYTALHALGWTHSVEVWERQPRGERELVGGIYGVAIGGLFAGESMFHRRTDTSKIAFATLVDKLRAGGFTLLDVQVLNEHIASLGCVEISRAEYLVQLEAALRTDAKLS